MQSQTITVFYQNESFPVDFIKLHNSSNKFRDMAKPYLDRGDDPQSLQLCIRYNKFTVRNVRNFLKMIQGQKNDVHSNEIAEICEIAKLFQNEALYNKSLNFVRARVDPNFTVPNEFDESNGEQYLEIGYLNDPNLQQSYNANYTGFDSTNDSTNLIPNYYPPQDQDNLPQIQDNLPQIQDNLPQSQNNLPQSQENSSPGNQQLHNVWYKIQILNPLMKCCRYFLSKDGRILFTAKKKSNEIYIGVGNNIHINGDGRETCARIMQCDGYNIAYLKDQEIKINYVPFGPKGQYSLETSFVHQGKNAFWSPRVIDQYLGGEYNHSSVTSKRNALLQNQSGAPTFAVRKMDNDVFEIECLSAVNPLIAFSIGLSQIIGPFT
ncbi:hypothetical protein M9Y10_027919 [Tritrichomonas musculus]|uniref:Tubby C-terminal domain-containing protein n=1 Tax=Tritrichomonas musculus TaxID=1915356 RepID=A0ABR2H4C0_9EUKA